MALARRLSSLGRSARSEAGVKVRQPLRRAVVFVAPGSPSLLADVVADELNVDEVVVAAELGQVLTLELAPNFRVLGPRLGESVKEVRGALGRLDAAAAAATLEAGGTVTVDLAGGAVELGPDEVDVRVRGQEGYAVSRQGGEVVALDLALDDDLRRRGVAREVVRHVQDLRRARGLEVSDRIRLWLSGIETGLFEPIGREVLAVSVDVGPGTGEGATLDGVDGAVAWLEKV
jgi:isoleucyl-tRNA synthetase